MPRVPSRAYTTLAIPDTLIGRVDAFIKKNSWGYRSRGEVTAAALREFLLRYAGAESGVTEVKPVPAEPKP
jgi:metal-responsive CopG/Arc/MetJ family transcriptional regulator